jgi:hypothetical protein
MAFWQPSRDMARWCEIYADEKGRLVVENHDNETARLERKVLTPVPFWRLTLPFRCHSCKVRVV